jgi:hypothetical protein
MCFINPGCTDRMTSQPELVEALARAAENDTADNEPSAMPMMQRQSYCATGTAAPTAERRCIRAAQGEH